MDFDKLIITDYSPISARGGRRRKRSRKLRTRRHRHRH